MGRGCASLPQLPAHAAPTFNSLQDLSQGAGVWIFVNDPQGAVWEQPPLAAARSVLLEAGFKLVMWTGLNDTLTTEAVAEIAGNLEQLFIWEATAQVFLSFTPTAPAFLNSAVALDTGDGVWLRMSHADTWEQPAPQGSS